MLRSKRKAIEISQGDPVTKPKVVSKAGRRVIAKRSKAVITRGVVLKRPVRSLTKTAKARPDNTELEVFFWNIFSEKKTGDILR